MTSSNYEIKILQVRLWKYIKNIPNKLVFFAFLTNDLQFSFFFLSNLVVLGLKKAKHFIIIYNNNFDSVRKRLVLIYITLTIFSNSFDKEPV